ncbi:MAG: ATPase domain-containing protein [Candidatus Methanomethylicia archaeon]
MLERVSTGIPKLDEIIGGGFIKGRSYLIAGGTGTGKTIMSLQYLLHGLKSNETCVYVSFDDRIFNVMTGVLNLGWNFDQYHRAGNFIPLEIRLRTEDLKHGKESKSFVKHILNYVGKRRIDRLVLDPISSLAQGVGDLLWVREYIREVVSYVEEDLGCTTILTADIPTGSTALSRYGVEEFISSGIIVLDFVEVGPKLFRVLYARKMRWSPMDMNKYVFDIQPNDGIVILGKLNEFMGKY